MPKKKPIAKRLDKLFEAITPEETVAQPSPISQKDTGVVPPTVEALHRPSPRPVKVSAPAPENELALSLPFQTGQNKWATLQVIDETAPRVWSEDEQLLVKQVADQLSLALENASLFQETQSRAEELSVLNEMGRELATKLEVGAIAEVVYRYTSRLMDTQNFFIALYDQKTEEKSYPLVFERGHRVELSPRKLGNRGFADYIIRTRKPIFAPADVLGQMKRLGIEFVPLHEDQSPPQCWLGMPMLIGERVMGLISVQDVQRTNVFDEHDRDILATIAGQAAIAIENARLFQEAQRRARETAALAEVGREISVTLDLGTVLTRIATYAKDLFQAETSAVYLPEIKTVNWRAIAVVGADADEIRNDPIQTGKGILGNIAVSKVGKIVNDASRTPEAVTVKGTIDMPYEHILAVPILSLDQVTGLMAVWRTGQGQEFSPAELDFLTSLARQAAIAIQNARLFNEVITSQGQLSEALQIARLGYFEIDLKNGTVQLTTELYSLLGTTAEEEGGYQLPLDSTMQKFIIEEDLPIMNQAIEEAAAAPDENPETEVEARFRTSDGRIIWVRSIFKLERDLEGQPIKVIGSSQDITDRKINALTQSAITQISDAALTASRMEDLIKTVHNVVGTLMPARNFYIALYDADSDLMTFPYYVDEYDDPMPPQKLGRGLTSYVIRTGQPLRTTPEIYAELQESGEVIGGGTRGVDWLGVPLRSESAIRGVMAVQSYNPAIRITEKHKEILTILGVQVTVAIERLQVREALAKSEADLRALFASMEDVVLVVDKDTRYLRIAPTNPSRLFRPPDELLGQRMDEILPANTHEPIREAIRRALTSDQTVQLEYELPINNQQYWFLANISKLNDDEVFWVARDITERKKSEEAIRRQNEYLAASAEISRLVTSTLELNTIFTRTVNLVSERFGFYYAAIYTIDESGFHAVLREATGAAGEKMKAQKYMVSVGAQTIVGKVTLTGDPKLVNDVSTEPLYQPNPLLLDTQSEVAVPLRVGSRIVGVIDIQSRQTQAFTQDDISVLQSLADQVAVAIDNARSYELSQQAVRELREVDQMKSQFLANMSHELRTPLNSIIGFSRVILKGIDGPVTEMQQQDLTAIYNSGQHLLGLINDVLDLARIEAGKMELNFEEVHLSDMVTSVMSTAKGLVKEKPIQLLQRIPADMPAVRGDPMRVRQVLLNLISNASKFTNEGSITVEALVQKGPTGKMEALVNVIDTGPGISIEDQKKLFQAFSQVDGSATRKSGGSGLGLSICANLVQLQGGRIGVNSDTGEGSVFYFTLPLFHQPVEEIPSDKKVILAIDDDPQVTGLYERYLNPQGYYVVPLTDPARAKERILELKPYAITLDIMMPNKDGWAVLSELKSDPDTRSYPVVICSILEQADKGFSLGAADYLVKPILQEDLVHALDRLNKNGTIQDVMVIDDDPNDLRLIEKILKEHGQYNPIPVQGGQMGWEAINAKAPDAIILDIFMPEMDGFTILERLRENDSLRDIPVLVVSSGELTNEQQQQLSDFGQHLISKAALNEDELIESIENALERIDPRPD
ncbi:MAG TPA: GAF domain-containing protein [Anaerolineales bacterium]|nr:GAF domain-containing protein [Anaerolineales bacterium]